MKQGLLSLQSSSWERLGSSNGISPRPPALILSAHISPVLTQRPHEAGLGHQDSLCLETANLLASAGSGIYEDLYDGRKKIKCERKWPRNAEIEMKD